MTSGNATPFHSSRSMTTLPGSLSSLNTADDGSQLFNLTVDQIKADHLEAARSNIKDADILAELEEDLDYDCERLRSFLLAAQVSFLGF